MLQTYVLNALSNPISLERAAQLMDSQIVQQVLNDGYSPEKCPQAFYGRYCFRHKMQHGEYFAPDIAESF